MRGSSSKGVHKNLEKAAQQAKTLLKGALQTEMGVKNPSANSLVGVMGSTAALMYEQGILPSVPPSSRAAKTIKDGQELNNVESTILQ